MSQTNNARRLRRAQTEEEKHLWRALRAGRFAGFKFRRQHPMGDYILDFYCPAARLDVELDGFQHGLPEEMEHDLVRQHYLTTQGVAVLRFWNHQWQTKREGVLLEIWNTLRLRTGCVQVLRKEQNQRFMPPEVDRIVPTPPLSPLNRGAREPETRGQLPTC